MVRGIWHRFTKRGGDFLAGYSRCLLYTLVNYNVGFESDSLSDITGSYHLVVDANDFEALRVENRNHDDLLGNPLAPPRRVKVLVTAAFRITAVEQPETNEIDHRPVYFQRRALSLLLLFLFTRSLLLFPRARSILFLSLFS